MKTEETIEGLLALVRFYKQKIDKGTLSGSEGGNYIKALTLLGLRDAALRNRHLELMRNEKEVLDLPFSSREPRVIE